MDDDKKAYMWNKLRNTKTVHIGEKFQNRLWVYKADLVQYSEIW